MIEYEAHNLLEQEHENLSWSITTQSNRILTIIATIIILMTVVYHSIKKQGTLK